MSKKIATPLARKAVLVSVTISQWTARKKDKRVTAETNRRHHASDDAGTYHKLLIQKERLAEINALVSAARALHYELTHPWADEGPRVLPNALFAKFSEKFRKLKREFDTAADDFARDYPQYIAERKVALNGLFSEADYPPVEQIRSKFKLDMTILPFPDSADFRADLDDDTVADIKRELEQTTARVGNDTLRHTAERITEAVGHMAEKLREYNSGNLGKDGKRNFFLNSLVDNVRDLAELLPAFNLTDDPKLNAITKRILKELCAEDAAELRKNDAARESVKKSADEIVKAVSQFLA
jgi:hypothetical protein